MLHLCQSYRLSSRLSCKRKEIRAGCRHQCRSRKRKAKCLCHDLHRRGCSDEGTCTAARAGIAFRPVKLFLINLAALCDEVEALLKSYEDHTQQDIDFHTAIALSSKNVVVPRLIPVINSSIPLFVETTGGILRKETIESHREIADAIACHDPVRAQDAMYLHLVYNRKGICNLSHKP